MPIEASNPGTQGPIGSSTGEQVRDAVRQQASAAWSDAKDTARSKLDDGKHTVASGIGHVARALRTSARDLEDGQQGSIARFAEGAAENLEHLSTTLERRDLEGLVRDAESMARERPAAFFCAAVAAGFLAVRFMKSSAPVPQPGGTP